MTLRYLVVASIALAAVSFALLVVREPRRSFVPPGDIASHMESRVASFASGTATDAEHDRVDEYQQQFKGARERAIALASGLFHDARALKTVAHLLTFLVMTCSLAIGLLGASRGVALSASPTTDEIA